MASDSWTWLRGRIFLRVGAKQVGAFGQRFGNILDDRWLKNRLQKISITNAVDGNDPALLFLFHFRSHHRTNNVLFLPENWLIKSSNISRSSFYSPTPWSATTSLLRKIWQPCMKSKNLHRALDFLDLLRRVYRSLRIFWNLRLFAVGVSISLEASAGLAHRV